MPTVRELPKPPVGTYWSVETSKFTEGFYLRLRDSEDTILIGGGIIPGHDVIALAERMLSDFRRMPRDHTDLGVTGYMYEGKEY